MVFTRVFIRVVCFTIACLFIFAQFSAQAESDDQFVLITENDKRPVPLFGEDAIRFFRQGSFFQKRDDFKRALEKYDAALHAGLLTWQVYINQGVCYSEMGDYDKAYNCFIDAHRTNPKNPLICKHLTYVTKKLGKDEESRGWFNKFKGL